MTDHHAERDRRARQFRLLLELMRTRSRTEAHGDCFLILNERPESGGAGHRIEESWNLHASQIVDACFGEGTAAAMESTGYRLVDPDDDVWRPDDKNPRFVQFAFVPKWFCLDLPRQTLAQSEAQVILRDLTSFFHVKDRPEFRLSGEPIDGFDPLRKIYLYGDETAAADDAARIFFDIWKFPVDWKFSMTAAAFSGKARFETDRELNLIRS